jgi:hypothetical protein
MLIPFICINLETSATTFNGSAYFRASVASKLFIMTPHTARTPKPLQTQQEHTTLPWIEVAKGIPYFQTEHGDVGHQSAKTMPSPGLNCRAFSNRKTLLL